MDRLTALVTTAHRRLRLRRLLIAIEQNPQLLDDLVMNEKRPPLMIPKPMQLAGMRSRLLRSQAQQKDLKQIGTDYDAVMDGIDEAKGALKGHVGDLKAYEASVRNTIESMLDRSNGGDPLDEEETGQSGQTSPGQGQAKSDDVHKDPQTIEPGAVGKVDAVLDGGAVVATDPEHLTVNGVSQN